MATKYIDLATGKVFFLTDDAAAGVNIDVMGGFHYLVAVDSDFYDTETGMRFAGGGGGFLDTYPAFAAYSTRQLSSTATNCMRVREDGTATEANIGFVDGWLDEAAISSHCGVNSGFVVTWYDQGGLYDGPQTNTAAQPQIYNGSIVLQKNGKPATLGGFVRLDGGASVTQPNTIFSVAEERGSFQTDYIVYDSGSAVNKNKITFYDGTLYFRSDTPEIGVVVPGSPSSHVITVLFNSPNSIARADGAELATGDTGTQAFPSPANIGNSHTGYFQEFILFNSDQTANFAAIEADINAAFSVYA